MRKDMAKVIVERPRYGSSQPSRKKGYRKYIRSMEIDELPSREPMLGRWRGMNRSLNEHLGPMQRFLRSRVGRPWNKVHQELCEHVSFDNAVQSHILDHIYDFVERHVEWRDGELVMSGHRWNSGRPVSPGKLYICPASGILKLVKPNRRIPEPQRVNRGKGLIGLRRGQEWYEVRLAPLPPNGDERWDVWLERFVSTDHKQACIALYGQKSFAISMCAISKRQRKSLLRQLQGARRAAKQQHQH